MDARYIAGFFDAEGSGMILTIKRKLKTGVIYRFRPVVKIAQKTNRVLELIKAYIGYGHTEQGAFIINGLEGVISFTETIAPYCHIKREVLLTISDLARFQQSHIRNVPYTKEQTEYMLDLRDKVFAFNSLTRSNLKQKYSKENILAETQFVDIRAWQIRRAEHGAKALEEAGKPYRWQKGVKGAS